MEYEPLLVEYKLGAFNDTLTQFHITSVSLLYASSVTDWIVLQAIEDVPHILSQMAI